MARMSIPRRRSKLVGREGDIEAITERVQTAPVVTLTGMGGVGKTRLALEVAARCDDRARVDFIELGEVSDPKGVARAVADGLELGVTDQSSEDVLVAHYAAGQKSLLVLDNCEQVVEGVADLVDLLVSECPDLCVLATSRERLDVEGEQVWPVQPLAVDGEGHVGAPAVELLIDRAEAAHPGVVEREGRERLAELAVRLEGLPLALELAAARMGTMSLDELIGQLDDHLLDLDTARRGTVDRHRSLGAVVRWSHDILEPPEQELLRRLAVFAGGFTREAAQVVVGLPSGAALERLVDASLLTVADRSGSTRYGMLAIIREFSIEQLAAHGEEDEYRRRHAEWAVALVEELRALARGPREVETVEQYKAELENIGAAFHWTTDTPEPELAERILVGLVDKYNSGSSREALAWPELAIDRLAGTPQQDTAILAAAGNAMVRGDLARIKHLSQLAKERRAHHPGILWGTTSLDAAVAMFEGRFDESIVLMDRWWDEVQGSDADDWNRVWVLVETSMPRAYRGDYREALERAERAIAMADSLENPTVRAWSVFCRGEALARVDGPQAIRDYTRALELAGTVENDFLSGVVTRARAAALARDDSDPVAALSGLGEAIRRWNELGARLFLIDTLRHVFRLFVRLELDEEARRLHGGLDALPEAMQMQSGGVDAEEDANRVDRLTFRLGEERFGRLGLEAAELDLNDLVRLALETIDRELWARRRRAELRVIVFTDLEQSTRFLAEEKDEGGREAMRWYDERTNAVLERYDGTRVKGTGDGVLAWFGNVSDALRAMGELEREVSEAVAADEHPLKLRVGVHVGETIEDMDDVHGTVVNLAARVVDRADGGEILVTDTVRQLVVGSSFEFESLGEAELKGIPEPMRLHRLLWR